MTQTITIEDLHLLNKANISIKTMLSTNFGNLITINTGKDTAVDLCLHGMIILAKFQ